MPAESTHHTMSIATVAKKNGVDLRKICMSVPFNNATKTPDEMFGHPFEYGLLGGVAIS